jgi:predicted transposase YbfD/YdcC
VVRIEAERSNGNSVKTEGGIRYYIVFVKLPKAARLNSGIREHWGIENKLRRGAGCGHWRRPLPQAACIAPQNFSLSNKIAHNLLRQDKTGELGIHGKRLKAGGTDDRLLKLLEN